MLNKKVLLMLSGVGLCVTSCTLGDPLECTQGRTQCIMIDNQTAQIQTCSADNKWDTGTFCKSGKCDETGMACQPFCLPNEIRCVTEKDENDADVAYEEICKSDTWERTKCASGLCDATNTACEPVCLPNEIRCVTETNKDGVTTAYEEVCNSDSWERTICLSGLCDDANRYCRPVCYNGETKCVQEKEDDVAQIFQCKDGAWDITDCLSGKCLTDKSDCEPVCEVSVLPFRKCVVEQTTDDSLSDEKAIEYSCALNKQSSSKTANNRYDWVEVKECPLGCTECPEGECEGTTCAVECNNGDTMCGERTICGNDNRCKTAIASQICQNNHWNVYEICSTGCDEGDRADKCKLDCEDNEVKCETSDRGIGVMYTCIDRKWSVSPCTGGAPCKDETTCGDPNTCSNLTRCEMPNGLEWGEYERMQKNTSEASSSDQATTALSIVKPSVFTRKVCNNNKWSTSVCSDQECKNCEVKCDEEGKRVCQNDFQLNTRINIPQSISSQAQIAVKDDALYQQVVVASKFDETIMICEDGVWKSEFCFGTCKNGVCEELSQPKKE